jgi:hypothetical protein
MTNLESWQSPPGYVRPLATLRQRSRHRPGSAGAGHSTSAEHPRALDYPRPRGRPEPRKARMPQARRRGRAARSEVTVRPVVHQGSSLVRAPAQIGARGVGDPRGSRWNPRTRINSGRTASPLAHLSAGAHGGNSAAPIRASPTATRLSSGTGQPFSRVSSARTKRSGPAT